MQMFLISDNIDTYTGMRLAGVEGVVVHTHDELKDALQNAISKKEIGIITGLCKDKVAELCENIPAACDSRVKLYFIKDVLNYLYNS